jgi:MoxR-like ATPase
MNSNQEWQIFKDLAEPHDDIDRLLQVPAPSWRRFVDVDRVDDPVFVGKDQVYWTTLQAQSETRSRDLERGKSFRVQQVVEEAKSTTSIVDAVNAAIYLRRPLLVTGNPGAGKTSLAYAIAYQLKLASVLVWAITARSNLQQGLYQYDAIARLQDAQLRQLEGQGTADQAARDIGQYIRLGPIGTAFLPSMRPRVLLIDEIDKSDINLPNELLNLLEEGRYEIPELRRLAKRASDVKQLVDSEDGISVEIESGKVQCREFPIVVMTSNGEREFPGAFLRRCVRVNMPDPSREDLVNIVTSHLKKEFELKGEEFERIIDCFKERNEEESGNLATDQLLNTLYLLMQDADEESMKELLFSSLTRLGRGQ